MKREQPDNAIIDASKLARTIIRAKAEVIEDVLAGRVPCGVASFAELHDYVDANGYGGAFEEYTGADDNGFWNRVQDAIDAWIKSGEMRAEAAKHPEA